MDASLLYARWEKHRSHPWIQRVRGHSVLQRCSAEGYTRHFGSADGECTGRAPASLHQSGADCGAGGYDQSLYSASD
ncbi:hypothetical protein D3C74_449370 [compost metagenome]